jgi:hypothetical protein
LNILAAFTITGLAVSISFNVNILHASIVDFGQCDLNFNKLWLSLSGTHILLSSSPSEETENVAESSSSAWWTSILDTFLSIFIIQLSFLRICQGLVGIGDSFEFVRIATLVRMFLESFFSE